MDLEYPLTQFPQETLITHPSLMKRVMSILETLITHPSLMKEGITSIDVLYRKRGGISKDKTMLIKRSQVLCVTSLDE